MKKSKLSGIISVIAIVGIAALAFWFATLPPSPLPPEPKWVKVRPLPEQQSEQPSGAGDEKAQPEAQVAATIAPPEIIVPKGHKPEIAIVIDDMGLNLAGSRRAIELPAYVTLSFMPYAERLKDQTEAARDNGHELLLHMPMEPIGHDDPGPGALFTSLPPAEVQARLEKALASFSDFDGINNHMGSKFTADEAGMEIVVDELKKRRLFFLDSRTSAKTVGYAVARTHNLPAINRDVFLDDDMSPAAIKMQLDETERIARHKGYAVAIGHPHDQTLQALEAWLPDAEERGFALVPLHDLVRGEGQ